MLNLIKLFFLRFEAAWLRSEAEYLDRQIAKQEAIIAVLDTRLALRRAL